MQLTSFRVTGLLGYFEHTISFPADWNFVILHGPNGVGKTKLLEILQAAATGQLPKLQALPFHRATLTFDNKQILEVTRNANLDGDAQALDMGLGLTFYLREKGKKRHDWTPQISTPQYTPRLMRIIDRELPVDRIGPRRWQDVRTGETYALPGLVAAFPELLKYSDFEVTEDDVSSVFGDFWNRLSVHLIETQRLLVLNVYEDDPRRSREGPSQRPTVSEYSIDMRRKLADALAQNSRASQDLDRSFPRRLLGPAAIPEGITDDQIRERYQQQNELRTRLAELSVLDTQEELPLPSKKLESWQRRVLWTYLDDSERKLATFAPLLERVTLLRDIVNSRLLRKRMVVDQNRGFDFVSKRGEHLRGEELSSGEQHEVVLLYDLLFNVKPGSLVLIDEPEISLHVAWQQEFLNDLEAISQVTECRFVVATHSPQIVHTWWDRAVALLPEDSSGKVD